jgi:glycerate dehydrogenase
MRPRIVVLDGYTLNPGDLSWDSLSALGDLTVLERCAAADIVTNAAGADIVLTNKAPLRADTIARLPELRYIGVTATGTNIVDHDAARARGIVVSNVPNYGSDSVAEHTLGCMLEASKQFAAHARAVSAGRWSAQSDFSLNVAPVRLLAGRTLGIVGLGAIGQRVAELARAFKVNVVATHSVSRGAESQALVRRASLEAVLEEADFLSLHCPLTPQTQHLINAARLARMKADAVLINTARGGLIDEEALAVALHAGRLGGAYLDVLSVEPPPADHVLLHAPRCWVTPHRAWASYEARARLLQLSVANVQAFLAGQPLNVV